MPEADTTGKARQGERSSEDEEGLRGDTVAQDWKKISKHIARAGLRAADPERAIRKYVQREGDRLCVGDTTYRLDRFRKILLIGAGT